MDHLFKKKTPIVDVRGVHLDLKGLPPTPKRLLELLDVFAAARYNLVLVEWEDAFPWSVDERFRCPTAYQIEDVRRFFEKAQAKDIEIVPLVQCLGHMETPLGAPGYEKLREIPDDPSGLNPLAPGAGELVERMVDDVLDVLPEVQRLHLGGDEAWTLGEHPDTRAHIEAHGKGDLYLRHVGPILDMLNERGVRPILWHDMMINWSDEELRGLAGKSDLMVWGYNGHPDETSAHFNTKHIKRFQENGVNLWAAGAYKGADGASRDLPDVDRRQANALAWIDVANRFEFQGIVATAWSRYSVHSLQCEPIDAALDALIGVGVILHDGVPMEGGVDACAAALEELGERQRFEACREAVKLLASVRGEGWKVVQEIKEQRVLSRRDERRNGAHILKIRKRYLNNILETSKEAEDKVKTSFAGLIDPIWIDEYLETRLTPLRSEGAGLLSATMSV